ncbi:hypothetical protein [Plantactinospora soyae]|uniref:Zn finger protein n=1 Tax=Plantactinospora soyae TaxID=1544732 RepID=A0A927MFJ1_9ACTN|nr:hypothetical protein [Plantactinospora soyae]MBE1492156.1 putative Zn finger protein [Plantactinospora soyae]
MAVRLDIDAIRNAVAPSTLKDAEKLLESGRLGEITPFGGGASCVLDRGSQPGYEVWVGVVGGEFTAECDCGGEPADPDELCVHAVALTLGALRDDFAWSSVATPPAQIAVDPEVRRLAEIAATIPARRLAMLIGEHAAQDRHLATRLLTYAGRLGAPTDTELANARRTIDNLANDATAGEWELHDVVKAGQWIVDELELLVQRLANDGILDVVEHAAEVWDDLARHLYDARHGYDDEAEEIGDAVRAVHLRLCEALQPDPDDLRDRVAEIVTAAEFTSCLDRPEDYLPLLSGGLRG